jgi:hypothetical protein
MTPQQEGGQHAQRVRSHPKVDEEEHKEEEQDAQHDEEEEEEMKDAKDENMMDACGDEQEEMVVQVAKINAETFIYPKPEPAEFSGGPMDKSVLTLYAGHIARHIFDGQVSYKFIFYNLIILLLFDSLCNFNLFNTICLLLFFFVGS